jgi:DNA-binding NarL/FixJ family response regulator
VKRLGVLIIEDDAVVRREIAHRISSSDDLEVVAQAGTLAEARRSLDSGAELALVDLQLPDGDATGLLPDLHRLGIASLVLTVSDRQQSVYRALVAGAGGYLLKADALDEVLVALRSVHEGGAPISPRVARWVLQEFRRRGPAASSPLTPRESELIEVFSRGATYAEAAKAMGVSANTVRQHVRKIYDKLHVGSKAEAVVAAMRLKG